MSEHTEPQGMGEDLHLLLHDLITEADRLRADRLRRQGERDVLWRKRMRAAAGASMFIGVLADHLLNHMADDDPLRIAATWIAEQTEHLDALLIAMAQEENEDE